MDSVLCWSCLRKSPSEESVCPHCRKVLCPSPEEARHLQDHVRFLLSEVDGWEGAPPRWRFELAEKYRERLRRLEGWESGEVPQELIPRAAPVLKNAPPVVEEAPPEPVEAAEAPIDTEIRGILAESNIRWFHTLGALLLLSAGVGYLRAEWDGWGRQVVALAMTILPFLFFAGARALRERLPVSSRLLAMIGGVMLPTGLLAIKHFHVFGLDLPTWFCFGISTAVLAWLTATLREVACLYMAAVTLVLAAGATGSGLALGLTAFGGAALCLRAGWNRDDELAPHLLKCSHLLGALGLLAGLVRAPFSHDAAASALLLGALYYASFAYMSGDSRQLVLSAVAGLGGAWACVNFLNLPAPWMGVGVMLQGTLYLRKGKEDNPLAALSFHIATIATGLTLIFSLGYPLFLGVLDNFAGFSTAELGTCALTGVLGSLFYLAIAYYYRRPAWIYASAGCVAYTYFVVVVLSLRTRPDLYPLLMVVLPLAWQGCALALRRLVPAEYLTPWVWSAIALGALLAPVNLAVQANQSAAPWVYAGVSVCCLFGTLWGRRADLLYPTVITATLAYAAWVPQVAGTSLHHVNWGLAFAPLALVLAVAARAIPAPPFAAPVLRASVLVGMLCVASQALFRDPLTLVLCGAGFLGGGWVFREWLWLGGSARQGAWSWTLWAWLGALALWQPKGDVALIACALAVVASVLTRQRILALAGMAYAPMFLVLPASEPARLLPALIWLVWPSLDRDGAAEARQSGYGATLLGWAALILHPHLLDTPVAVALLCGLTGFVSWRLADPGHAVCSWSFGVGLCFQLTDVMGAPFAVWWALQAVTSRFVPPLAVVTAVLVLFLSHGGWAVSTAGVFAAAALVAALSARSQRFVTAFAVLLTLTLFRLIGYAHWSVAEFALALSLQVLLLFGMSAALPWTTRFNARYGSVLSAAAIVLGAGQWHVLLLSAAAWAWRSRLATGERPEGPENFWVSALCLYLILLPHLDGALVELYTLPWALWMLVWAEWAAGSNDRLWRRLGLFAMLGPSLMLSMNGTGVHTVIGGGLGLILVLAGVMLQKRVYQTAGSLALMVEMAIQAVSVAVNLPWYLLATLAGVLLVALGVTFERQRQVWAAAKDRLAGRFSEL